MIMIIIPHNERIREKVLAVCFHALFVREHRPLRSSPPAQQRHSICAGYISHIALTSRSDGGIGQPACSALLVLLSLAGSALLCLNLAWCCRLGRYNR